MEAHRYREALQPKLDEPVLAGGLFYRAGAWDAFALGPFSALAALIRDALDRRRTARLPKRFLLAVTPTHVHAFRCALAGDDVKAKEELAVWERSGLTVTAEETASATRVVIESAPDGGRIVCATGKDDLSQSVVYAMQEQVGAPVAA